MTTLQPYDPAPYRLRGLLLTAPQLISLFKSLASTLFLLLSQFSTAPLGPFSTTPPLNFYSCPSADFHASLEHNPPAPELDFERLLGNVSANALPQLAC